MFLRGLCPRTHWRTLSGNELKYSLGLDLPDGRKCTSDMTYVCDESNENCFCSYVDLKIDGEGEFASCSSFSAESRETGKVLGFLGVVAKTFACK